uniref:Heat shock protein n=1 Tax=Cicer arietinum TaxID=3827 RepID=A0A076L221_CICAR|nr:heat shock protein [Cicer arietinum]
MESKHAHNYRSYEDFDPVFKWRREEARFKREQIRIQINHHGVLVISGERPLDETKWRRFKKEFQISQYCNEDAIRGNFMDNILSIVMPKKVSFIPQEEQIPELEDDEDDIYQDKTTFHNMEFQGKSRAEQTEDYKFKDALLDSEYTYTTNNHFEENDVETTREVALKFMVVIIVLMVIVNFLVDMSKSFMA